MWVPFYCSDGKGNSFESRILCKIDGFAESLAQNVKRQSLSAEAFP